MATVLDLAVEVHGRLTKLIAPVTPGSIAASSLRPTRNVSLFIIGLLAIVSLVAFIFPILVPPEKGDHGADLRDLWQILGGAGLGASFYALYTAMPYLQTSTFGPRYNNTYLIRFGLGILAGLILAYFLKDLVKVGSNAESNAPNLRNIGVSTLALIGGFGADAVAQVLMRVADTLVTLVGGSARDKIDAAKQKADADAAQKVVQERNDTANKMQEALNLPPAQQIAAIQKVLAELLKK